MKRPASLLFYGSLLLAGGYAAVAAVFSVIEPRLVFPVRPVDDVTLREWETEQNATPLRLVTQDGVTLYGWRIGSAPKLVVIFTGNAASVGDNPARYKRFLDLGFSVLHVNYRGYPGSTGAPSEAGLRLDAGTIWTEALRTHTPNSIAVYAKSLGGGVAVGLVAGLHHDAQPAALVLDSTFTSALAVAAMSHPLLPVRWIMKNRFDSASLAPAIACPTLIVHGREDTTIPVEHGHELQRLIPGARIHTVPGGGHDDDLLADPDTWQSVSELLTRAVRQSSIPLEVVPDHSRGEQRVGGPGGG